MRDAIATGGIAGARVAPDDMSPEEFDAMLSHSYAQSLSGEGRPYEDAFDELERNLT